MSDDWEKEHNLIDTIIVNKVERTKRMNLCKKCEDLSNLNICKNCSCFMPAKTWVTDKKCPLGKW